MLGRRVFGSYEDAFVVVHQPHGALVPVVDRLTQLAPLKFLSTPGLWIGLAFAVAFVAATVRYAVIADHSDSHIRFNHSHKGETNE